MYNIFILFEGLVILGFHCISDRNDDDILTEDEFAQLKVGDNGEALLSQGEKERREEFRSLVDTNNDGKADRKELVVSNFC